MNFLFKKNISEIYNDIKKAFKERDYSSLLDYLVLLLFLSAIIFTVIYKASIYLEKWLFDSSYLVLTSRVKSYLPQLMLYALLGIIFLKWILYAKAGGKGKKDEDKINDTVSLRFRNKVYVLKKDTLYIIGLMLIIFIFIASKIPYWDISFTVNYPLKYNTYVDPALSMLKHDDPFIIQRNYMHNPISNSLGMGIQYGSLPILEWSLFTGYKLLLSYMPMEAITRLVMLIWGSIALTSFFIFIKKYLNNRIALISTFLLSLNAIFNLSFFVTVYDSILFCLTFISFSLLFDSVKEKNLTKFGASALMLGIGASVKENILIWSLPFVFVYLLLAYKRDINTFISKIFLHLTAVIFPYIIFLTTLNFFPTKEVKYFIGFLVLSIFLGIFIWKIEKIYKFFVNITSSITKFISGHKKILWLSPILIILIVMGVYSTTVSEEFLTDWTLLFNPDLYLRFLNDQIIPYTGRFLFYILLLSIPLLIFYSKKRRINNAIIAIFAGSLFYIVIASKALFFHSYYWLFILASIEIFTTWGILFIKDTFIKKSIRPIFLCLLLGTIFLYTSPSVKAKLNRQYYEVEDVIEYINSESFEDGTSFIDQANLAYLTMKTDLYRVYGNEVFATEEFKSSVKEIGFIETMKKYKILYLITEEASADFTAFANSFSANNLEDNYLRRTDLILSSLYSNEEYFDDTSIRNKILSDNNIQDQFKLIRDFGQYKIYKLTEACFKTVIE
jgi:hypothetical protein